MSHLLSRQMSPDARRASVNSATLISPLKAVMSLYYLLVIWNSRWQERQHLRDLDEHILQDIGLSCDEVWQEARKPFWRA
jgi:uncharacterized protein YjiS (DUF1127 family)